MEPRRTNWADLSAEPLTEQGRAAYESEARRSRFRELVFQVLSEMRSKLRSVKF